MIDYLSVQGGKVLLENRELRFPEKKEIRVDNCGRGIRLFDRQAFFFCRFIGLERRMLAWQCAGRVGEVLSVFGKFRRQRIILLATAKPQKRKITVGKTGKTIRGCRDKHQGNLFGRDGARKVSTAGEAPGDSTDGCVPFVLPGFAFPFWHVACRSA